MGRLGYLFERFPSFTQTFCARELAALRRQGFDGPVFSIRNPADEPRPEGDFGPITRLPESFSEIISSDAGFRREARQAQKALVALWGGEQEKRRIYEALWLERACAKTATRHLHVHFAGLAARTAFWLRRRGGPAFSVTAHANDIFRDEPPERLGQVLEAAALIVTVSDFSRNQLARRYPGIACKLHRVYNGIAVPASPHPPATGRPLVLAVGRAIEKKGFSDLIAACALISDLDFECRIVGGGPLESALREQVVAAGLSSRVEVCGPRPEAEIHRMLAECRCFVLPCVELPDGASDNLPTVIMEAMAAGRAVISTPVAGVPEMVEHGATGWIVPQRSPAALAEALRRLILEPDTATELGRAGHDKCRSQFEVAATSAQLIGLFESCGAWP